MENYESLVEKYNNIRNSIPYVKVVPNRYDDIANAKYWNLRLTVSERTEMVKSESQRLYQEAVLLRKDYIKEIAEINEAWKSDLFKEFGVSDNPKKELCYNLAYEYGHSSGYSEIYNYFSTLVELIKK